MRAETHLNKSVRLREDISKSREITIIYCRCVSHYRTGQHAQLTESGICFKSERANGKLALDLDHGFACYMTSVGSPAECRFYSFRWKENEVLPSTVYAANVSKKQTFGNY